MWTHYRLLECSRAKTPSPRQYLSFFARKNHSTANYILKNIVENAIATGFTRPESMSSHWPEPEQLVDRGLIARQLDGSELRRFNRAPAADFRSRLAIEPSACPVRTSAFDPVQTFSSAMSAQRQKRASPAGRRADFDPPISSHETNILRSCCQHSKPRALSTGFYAPRRYYFASSLMRASRARRTGLEASRKLTASRRVKPLCRPCAIAFLISRRSRITAMTSSES